MKIVHANFPGKSIRVVFCMPFIGTNSCFDFRNISLNLPLEYFPVIELLLLPWIPVLHWPKIPHYPAVYFSFLVAFHFHTSFLWGILSAHPLYNHAQDIC